MGKCRLDYTIFRMIAWLFLFWSSSEDREPSPFKVLLLLFGVLWKVFGRLMADPVIFKILLIDLVLAESPTIFLDDPAKLVILGQSSLGL